MTLFEDPVARLLVLGIVGLGGVLAVLIGLKRPWWTTVAALASLPLIPYWAGYGVAGFFISIQMILLATAIVASVLQRRSLPRLNLVDLVLLAVWGIILGGIPLGLTTLTQGYAIFQWLLVYAFARIATHTFGFRRIATVVGITFGLAAVAIIAEAVTGTNLWAQYATFPNSLYSRWSVLQSRGGVLRAEGAFGHSIAAGCSLALAAVITLDAKLKIGIRLLIVAVLCAAILTTLSRIGITTAALGIGLAVVFARSSLSITARAATLLVGAVGAVVYTVALADIFSDAGSEASNSASYRLWLLDLLPYVEPLGFASIATRSTTGELSFGAYRSIDNAVLHFALSNGWVPTVLLLVVFLTAIARMVSLRGGVALAALVSTIPALLTVALITQYGLVFWLVAGLAASESLSPRDPELSPDVDSFPLPPDRVTDAPPIR